jgi:hypothetical protein
VAAMLEYGVPVIVNREDAHFRVPVPEDSEALFLRCDEQLASRLLENPVRGPALSRREGRLESSLPICLEQSLGGMGTKYD